MLAGQARFNMTDVLACQLQLVGLPEHDIAALAQYTQDGEDEVGAADSGMVFQSFSERLWTVRVCSKQQVDHDAASTAQLQVTSRPVFGNTSPSDAAGETFAVPFHASRLQDVEIPGALYIFGNSYATRTAFNMDHLELLMDMLAKRGTIRGVLYGSSVQVDWAHGTMGIDEATERKRRKDDEAQWRRDQEDPMILRRWWCHS